MQKETTAEAVVTKDITLENFATFVEQQQTTKKVNPEAYKTTMLEARMELKRFSKMENELTTHSYLIYRKTLIIKKLERNLSLSGKKPLENCLQKNS